jgi:hypothetical protein
VFASTSELGFSEFPRTLDGGAMLLGSAMLRFGGAMLCYARPRVSQTHNKGSFSINSALTVVNSKISLVILWWWW